MKRPFELLLYAQKCGYDTNLALVSFSYLQEEV